MFNLLNKYSKINTENGKPISVDRIDKNKCANHNWIAAILFVIREVLYEFRNEIVLYLSHWSKISPLTVNSDMSLILQQFHSVVDIV